MILETLGPLKQKYFAKRIKKSRINDKDLSMIYTEIMSKKMPAIIITNASFTKKAKNFLNKELKDLIRIIKG